MPLLPLRSPLQSKAILPLSLRLFKASWLKALPFSLITVLLYHFICFGQSYLPESMPFSHQQAAVSMLLLFLPLFAITGKLIDTAGKGQPVKAGLFAVAYQSFLGLMSCIIALLLLPLIIFTAGIALYFALGIYLPQLHPAFLFTWLIFIKTIAFTSMLSKIFAPVLVITKDQDGQPALEQSERLVNGFFIRTWIYSAFGLMLLLWASQLPTLFAFYLPQIPTWAMALGAQGLLVILFPWFISLLLAQQYDLMARSKPVTKKSFTPPLKEGDHITF